MTRILLLSDTHGLVDDQLLKYVKQADEVWHAGDIGSTLVSDQIKALKPLRAVYGNVDNKELRAEFPLDQDFTIDGLHVIMTHIGGYPGRYTARVRALLSEKVPDLYICGHSHILKVQRDTKLDLMHMNPGAAGKHGFHQIRTMLRFKIDSGELKDLEVIELGKRG